VCRQQSLMAGAQWRERVSVVQHKNPGFPRRLDGARTKDKLRRACGSARALSWTYLQHPSYRSNPCNVPHFM
jgi:hypothetical protein